MRAAHFTFGNDYIGFTLNTNDELDYISFESSYFTELGNDTYFRLSASNFDITELEIDSTLFTADYYFNGKTSVSIAASTDDWHVISAKYFFNHNLAVYSSFSNDYGNTLIIGLTGHF